MASIVPTLWQRIDVPAVAFVYSGGRFSVAARIWRKEPICGDDATGNPALAEEVWADPTFEHIVYLDEVEEIDVAAKT